MIRYILLLVCVIFSLCAGSGYLYADIRITELFIDGSDERIELYNDSAYPRQGTLILSGVRSSGVLEHTTYIHAHSTLIIADDIARMSHVPGLVEEGSYKLSLSDTQALHIEVLTKSGIQDTLMLSATQVAAINNTPVSFEYYQGNWQATSPQRSSGVLSGYQSNPGMYPFVPGGTSGMNLTGGSTGVSTGVSTEASGVTTGQVLYTGSSGSISSGSVGIISGNTVVTGSGVGIVIQSGSNIGSNIGSSTGSSMGIYTGSTTGNTGTIIGNMTGTYPPNGTVGSGIAPGVPHSTCHSTLPRPLSIQEIYLGNSYNSSYIELYVHTQRSGSIQLTSTGMHEIVTIGQVYPGEHILIASSTQGLHHTDNVYSIPGRSLGMSGNIQLSSYGSASGWSQLVVWDNSSHTSSEDFSIYVDSLSTLSTSVGYQGGQAFSPGGNCFDEAASHDLPSPGFHRKRLAYLPVQHHTHTEYVQSSCPASGGSSAGGSSSSGAPVGSSSGVSVGSSGSSGGTSVSGSNLSGSTAGGTSGSVNTSGSVLYGLTEASLTGSSAHTGTYTGAAMLTSGSLGTGREIFLIDYNPPGSDIGRERIGIRYLQGPSTVSFLSGWRLEYDNKTYHFSSGVLVPEEEVIRVDNFRFVNSRPVCVMLWYHTIPITESCYDPSVHDSPHYPYEISSGDSDLDDTTQAHTAGSSEGQELPSPGQLHIDAVVYDPPGSDTNNESVTLRSSADSTVDMTDRRIRVNDRNKRIDIVLSPGQSETIVKTWGLSNSRATCLELVYEDTIYDTYCYDPDDDKYTQENSQENSQENTKEQAQEQNNTDPHQSDIWTGSVAIVSLIYDPPGADTDQEMLELQYASSQSPDFSQGRYLMVNDKRVSLISYERESLTTTTQLYGTFSLYNSRYTCVQLWQDIASRVENPSSGAEDFLHDTYCYDPDKKQMDTHKDGHNQSDTTVYDQSDASMQYAQDNTTMHPSLVALLPNPAGADKDKEYLRLAWSGTEHLSLQQYSISVNGRNTKRAATPVLAPQSSSVHQISSSLPNALTCVRLWFQKETLVDSLCYIQTDDDRRIYTSIPELESLSQNELSILRTVRQRNRGEYVCQERSSYRLGCRKRVIRTLPLQELRIKTAYIRQLESHLKDNRYRLWEHSSLSYYAEVYRWALAHDKSGEKQIWFGDIPVATHQLDLWGVLAYTQLDIRIEQGQEYRDTMLTGLVTQLRYVMQVPYQVTDLSYHY